MLPQLLPLLLVTEIVRFPQIFSFISYSISPACARSCEQACPLTLSTFLRADSEELEVELEGGASKGQPATWRRLNDARLHGARE